MRIVHQHSQRSGEFEFKETYETYNLSLQYVWNSKSFAWQGKLLLSKKTLASFQPLTQRQLNSCLFPQVCLGKNMRRGGTLQDFRTLPRPCGTWTLPALCYARANHPRALKKGCLPSKARAESTSACNWESQASWNNIDKLLTSKNRNTKYA